MTAPNGPSQQACILQSMREVSTSASSIHRWKPLKPFLKVHVLRRETRQEISIWRNAMAQVGWLFFPPKRSILMAPDRQALLWVILLRWVPWRMSWNQGILPWHLPAPNPTLAIWRAVQGHPSSSGLWFMKLKVQRRNAFHDLRLELQASWSAWGAEE